MSSTQSLSDIATGLRAVDCELDAMRSLNGTLVSALTAVMGPRTEDYKDRYGTGSKEGLEEVLRNDPDMSAFLSSMNHDARLALERMFIKFASKCCDMAHTHDSDELNRLLLTSGGAIKVKQDFETHLVQAKELTRDAKQECKKGITLTEGTSRGRLALKSVEAADEMTAWQDAIVKMLCEEGHIEGLISKLKAKDIDLADQDLDAFMEQDTKKVDDAMNRLEKRKSKLIDNLIDRYGSSLVISENPKDKDKSSAYSPVCPSHVDRQKGAQLGSMNVVYCKKHMRNCYAIFPFINNMVNGYNPVTGMFPEPPCEDNNYAGIPFEMVDRYKQQSRALYDLYESGGWPKDVLKVNRLKGSKLKGSKLKGSKAKGIKKLKGLRLSHGLTWTFPITGKVTVKLTHSQVDCLPPRPSSVDIFRDGFSQSRSTEILFSSVVSFYVAIRIACLTSVVCLFCPLSVVCLSSVVCSGVCLSSVACLFWRLFCLMFCRLSVFCLFCRVSFLLSVCLLSVSFSLVCPASIFCRLSLSSLLSSVVCLSCLVCLLR